MMLLDEKKVGLRKRDGAFTLEFFNFFIICYCALILYFLYAATQVCLAAEYSLHHMFLPWFSMLFFYFIL